MRKEALFIMAMAAAGVEEGGCATQEHIQRSAPVEVASSAPPPDPKVDSNGHTICSPDFLRYWAKHDVLEAVLTSTVTPEMNKASAVEAAQKYIEDTMKVNGSCIKPYYVTSKGDEKYSFGLDDMAQSGLGGMVRNPPYIASFIVNDPAYNEDRGVLLALNDDFKVIAGGYYCENRPYGKCVNLDMGIPAESKKQSPLYCDQTNTSPIIDELKKMDSEGLSLSHTATTTSRRDNLRTESSYSRIEYEVRNREVEVPEELAGFVPSRSIRGDIQIFITGGSVDFQKRSFLQKLGDRKDEIYIASLEMKGQYANKPFGYSLLAFDRNFQYIGEDFVCENCPCEEKKPGLPDAKKVFERKGENVSRRHLMRRSLPMTTTKNLPEEVQEINEWLKRESAN